MRSVEQSSQEAENIMTHPNPGLAMEKELENRVKSAILRGERVFLTDNDTLRTGIATKKDGMIAIGLNKRLSVLNKTLEKYGFKKQATLIKHDHEGNFEAIHKSNNSRLRFIVSEHEFTYSDDPMIISRVYAVGVGIKIHKRREKPAR